MKRLVLVLVALLSLTAPVFAQGGLSVACQAVAAYPAGQIYQNLTANGFGTNGTTLQPSPLSLDPACTRVSTALTEDATNSLHQVNDGTNTGINFNIGTTLTMTIYAKQVIGGLTGTTSRGIFIQINPPDFSSNAQIGFPPGGCNTVALNANGAFSNPTLVSCGEIQGGWTKIVWTWTMVSTVNHPFLQWEMNSSGGTTPYLGDGIETMVFWGVDIR